MVVATTHSSGMENCVGRKSLSLPSSYPGYTNDNNEASSPPHPFGKADWQSHLPIFTRQEGDRELSGIVGIKGVHCSTTVEKQQLLAADGCRSYKMTSWSPLSW